MPKLRDIKTGEEINVGHYDVPERLGSGQFDLVDTETYRMRDSAGRLRDIEGSLARRAIRERLGFSFDDPEVRRAELEAEGRAAAYDQPLIAGLEGFGRGATLGLLDVAERVIGDPEGARRRREASPVAATIGELGGVIAPSLLSGGTGAAGIVARLTPAGAASRLGMGIARRGGVGAAAAGFGLEGALFNAGQYVSDVALENRDLSAEGFVGSLAEGGAIGAVLGGAFHIVGNRANKALEAAKGKLGNLPPESLPPESLPPESLLEPVERGLLGKVTRIDPLRAQAKARAFEEKLVAQEGRAAAKAEREFERAKTLPITPSAQVPIAPAVPQEVTSVAGLKELEDLIYGQSKNIVGADRIYPKGKLPAIEKKAVEGFSRASDEAAWISDELDTLAGKRIDIARASGNDAYVQQIEGALKNFRAHRTRFDAWLEAEHRPLVAAGPKTLVHKRRMIEYAEEVAGELSPEDLASARRAAHWYGKDIAARRRAAWAAKKAGPEAQKVAGQRALPEVPPESEMYGALKEIRRIKSAQRQMGHAAEIPAYADLGDLGVKRNIAGRDLPDLANFRDIKGAPIAATSDVRLEEIRKVFRGGQKRVDAMWPPDGRGVVVTVRPNGLMDVVDGRHRLIVAKEFPDIKIPVQFERGIDVGRTLPGRAPRPSPGGKIDPRTLVSDAILGAPPPAVGAPVAGPSLARGTPREISTEEIQQIVKRFFPEEVSTPPGKTMPGFKGRARGTPPNAPHAARDAKLAEDLDTIAGYERAQHELYSTIKPSLPPATAARLDGHFAPYAEKAAKGEAKGNLFRGFRDVLGAVELLQTLGVPGMPDVDRLPVIGPLLGWYAKYRGAKLALRKLGILRTADVAAAERSAGYRNRIADGVSRFVRRAGPTAAKAGIPATVAILNAPLWSQLWPDRKRKQQQSKAQGHDAAVAALDQRRLEIARARADADMLRKHISMGSPDWQQAIMDAVARQLDFLDSKLPRDPDPPNPLGLPSNWQPSPDELRRFARFFRAATDPATVVEDLAARRLMPEAVEAIRAVAPGLYDEIRTELIEQAAEHELDYRQRVQASILFDAPVEPTEAPEFTARLAMASAPVAETPSPSGFGGPGLGEAATLGLDRRAGK